MWWILTYLDPRYIRRNFLDLKLALASLHQKSLRQQFASRGRFAQFFRRDATKVNHLRVRVEVGLNEHVDWNLDATDDGIIGRERHFLVIAARGNGGRYLSH